MTVKELRKYIKLCQSFGVRTFKVQGIELEFWQNHVYRANRGSNVIADVNEDREIKDLIPKPNLAEMPTDEEMLFHSVPGWEPETQEETIKQ